MTKTHELKGMPVLALEEGERLGQVRELILDPVARQVVALILDRRVGGEDQIIATANIRSVGADAITVENRSSLIPLNRMPRFQELSRLGKTVHGKVVISEAGKRLGQVDDLEVDVETFGLVSLVLKAFLRRGEVIPADRVRTIGADAIVVCEKEPPEVAPEPEPEPIPEPVPPAMDVEEVLPLGPDEELPPVEEPIPPPVEAPVPVPEEPFLPPTEAEAGPPLEEEPPSTPVPEEGEPLLAPSATALPPKAEPDVSTVEEPPAEDAAGEEDENAWQRWVRRLKGGD